MSEALLNQTANIEAVQDRRFEFKATRATYLMGCVLTAPLVALAIFLFIKQPDDKLFAYACLAIAAFCFINIAAIRLRFDGYQVSYTSLMKRTKVKIEDIIGANISYMQSGGNSAAFFFLETEKRDDIMMNLKMFKNEDVREFCQLMTDMGIVPSVAPGLRTKLLVKDFYPDGIPGLSEDELDS